MHGDWRDGSVGDVLAAHHEGLSLDPRAQVKDEILVVRHACRPSAGV